MPKFQIQPKHLGGPHPTKKRLQLRYLRNNKLDAFRYMYSQGEKQEKKRLNPKSQNPFHLLTDNPSSSYTPIHHTYAILPSMYVLTGPSIRRSVSAPLQSTYVLNQLSVCMYVLYTSASWLSNAKRKRPNESHLPKREESTHSTFPRTLAFSCSYLLISPRLNKCVLYSGRG